MSRTVTPWLPPAGAMPAWLAGMKLGIVEATYRDTWRADVRDATTSQLVPMCRVTSPWMPIRTDRDKGDLSMAMYGYASGTDGPNPQDPYCFPIPASCFDPTARETLEWCLRTESAEVTLQNGGPLVVKVADGVPVKIIGGSGVEINSSKSDTLRRVARKDDPIEVALLLPPVGEDPPGPTELQQWILAATTKLNALPGPPVVPPTSIIGTITDGNPNLLSD